MPTSDNRSFRSASIRSEGVLDVIILLGLSGSWLGLLGRWHWTLDLFSHFRWQYLLISLFALAWTLWRRRRVVLVLALATLLLNGWLIGRLAWAPEMNASLTADFELRVLSLNVLSSNLDHAQVLSYIRSADADVIFAMEVNHVWAQALQPVTESHPHHLLHPRPDNFGAALFSRLPLDSLDIIYLGKAEVPTIEARLTHQGHELVILGTHPLPPISAAYAELQYGQLSALSQHVDQMELPVLLVGDLNATPWSEGMRILLRGGALGFRSVRPPYVSTWRVRSVFAIPIDHALCTAPLIVMRRAVGPDVGSDHRPLLLEIGWAREPADPPRSKDKSAR